MIIILSHTCSMYFNAFSDFNLHFRHPSYDVNCKILGEVAYFHVVILHIASQRIFCKIFESRDWLYHQVLKALSDYGCAADVCVAIARKWRRQRKICAAANRAPKCSVQWILAASTAFAKLAASAAVASFGMCCWEMLISTRFTSAASQFDLRTLLVVTYHHDAVVFYAHCHVHFYYTVKRWAFCNIERGSWYFEEHGGHVRAREG